jgi:TIR domain
MIDILHLLIEKAIEFYSCFISYSSKDDAFARQLHADLQAAGVRCWFVPEDMMIGDRIRPRIDESIRMYDRLLLVLSEHSVSSKWVEFEVEAAMDREQEGKPPVLFPVRLDNTVMESTTAWAAHIKRTRHIGDFTRWKNHDDYQKAFTGLLRDLKAEAEQAELGFG